MSAPCRYAKSSDAKKDGWFSRRHKTRAAHDDTRSVLSARRLEKFPQGPGRKYRLSIAGDNP